MSRSQPSATMRDMADRIAALEAGNAKSRADALKEASHICYQVANAFFLLGDEKGERAALRCRMEINARAALSAPADGQGGEG